MYNRTKKEIHDRIVVLHAEERQQGIVKDALNKLSEQERRSMEKNIVYGIRIERNICQQEMCLSEFTRERCLNKVISTWI